MPIFSGLGLWYYFTIAYVQSVETCLGAVFTYVVYTVQANMLQNLRKCVTLEPVIFLFGFGWSILNSSKVHTNLLMWKICHLEFGYNDTICTDLTNESHVEVMEQVQIRLNNFEMVRMSRVMILIQLHKKVSGWAMVSKYSWSSLFIFCWKLVWWLWKKTMHISTLIWIYNRIIFLHCQLHLD